VNEQAAIRLCLKDRDPRGFEFLVQKYRREAYYHAYGMLGNQADAEEACQESFTKAFESLPRLDALTAFYPWFYRILRNGCLNRLRRYNRQHQIALEEEPAGGTDIEAEVASEQVSAAVWQTLERLKPEFTEILVLKHFRDASYDEISQLLNIPRGTVMSRLFHARKAFQHTFEQLTHGEANHV